MAFSPSCLECFMPIYNVTYRFHGGLEMEYDDMDDRSTGLVLSATAERYATRNNYHTALAEGVTERSTKSLARYL